MKNIIRSFKDKRFRYGSFSTVMVLVAIGLFVLVNLVADQLNVSHDLTRERIFSLSQGSVTIARELTEDVTIYSLFPTGQENFMFQQLLDEYAANSNHITVSNRDPILQPQFVEQFARPEEPISNGSIIVVGPNRHRVIQAEDLVTTEFDWNTFQSRLRSFDLEPQVTNAINYVIMDETPIIYRVTGNNEFDLPPALIEEIEMSGYTIREVNLMTDEVPEEADMLLITYPERDWSPDKAERILTYLQNDGRALFILGFRGERFQRVDEVLAAFGVRVGDYVILEGNPNHFVGNIPNMLLPGFVSGEITDMLIERDFSPLFMTATGIETLELRRASTNIQPLIRTSNQAFGRSDPEGQAMATQAPGDIDGPFDLAVAISDHMMVAGGGSSLTTRMVIIGTDFILVEDFNDAMSGANWSFLVNSLNWLREEPSRVFIAGRAPVGIVPLSMTQAQQGMTALFSVIILPLIFAVTGLVVWLRRRNA